VRLFDRTLGTLERALDARLLRHEVLAGNLANANTPGFQPREVDFAAAMARAAAERPEPGERAGEIPLALADGSRAGAPGSPVATASGAPAGLDGNGVDVDRALVAVAENAVQYGAAARAAGKKLAILRYAASDGVG
jgi:flagellar basal-body rod protein FlgB